MRSMHYDVSHDITAEDGLKQLTIRGVDESLGAALKREAATRNLSVNRFVLEILRAATGLETTVGRRPEHTDLDHLAGVLSEPETRELQASVEAQRQVDEGLWR